MRKRESNKILGAKWILTSLTIVFEDKIATIAKKISRYCHLGIDPVKNVISQDINQSTSSDINMRLIAP